VTISGVGSAFGTTDASSTRDHRVDDSSASQSFAGIMSNAMSTRAPKPEDKRPSDATSELDKPESKDEDDSETESTKKTHHHHAAAKPKAPTSSSSSVDQSVADLDPALQDKLARVMERMRTETGHDVQVAETFRPQSRQDALYAQGRETTGPVVTWTQNSKHTQGRAADLVLDGGTAGTDAYQALQRIANEEGLRTLGARDPGHIELRGSDTGAAASDAISTNPTEPADATGSGQVSIARLAQLGRVADVKVEQPAPVARVAQVATVAGVAAATLKGGKSGRDSSSDTGTQSDSRNGYSALGAAVAARSDASTQFPAQAVAAATGSTAAERTEKILAAMDNAPVRPLSQITMAIDGANGSTDRIQLSMRGSSLNTTIDVSDPRAVQAMTTHSDELIRALNRDGIQVDSLRVRAGTETVSAITAPNAGQAAQSSNDAASHSRFDRGDAWGQQQDQQDQQDQQNRQQSKQQRNFSRQQQRQQRGGQQ
jgi:peptidoglycan L-alanyl-D-glutamate endopeptidase CwlK